MRLYNNRPGQYPGLDLSPITVTGVFWRSGENRDELPDRDYFVEQCQGEGPLCINVEHWYWDIRRTPHATVDESLRKLETLTRWATVAFPGRVVGHYSIFPNRDYWTPQHSRLLHPLRWHQWRRSNGYMKKSRDANGRYNGVGLADLSHITMPSLYTFYEDRAGWVTYAKANIAEARKYGKPVVPFLWPRYHDSGTRKYEGIEADYWRLQLDTLAECGITQAVVWDAARHFTKPHIGGEAWTEQTPWIAATQQYIEDTK